jgi:hypothetical protein
MADPILNHSEVILKKAGAREFLSYGRMGVWLTLTNQRLIVQPLLGREVSYPLSHVSRAGQIDYYSQGSITSVKALRLDFDNGGVLLFGLGGELPWVQAIEQARTGAPDMPYTTPPAPQTMPSGPSKIALIGLILGPIALCSMTALIILVIVLSRFLR